MDVRLTTRSEFGRALAVHGGGIIAGLVIGVVAWFAIGAAWPSESHLAQNAAFLASAFLSWYLSDLLHDRWEHRYGRHCGRVKHKT
jgi:NhaP-type Na+/H+ or K+/H+ antiporter